MTPTYDGNGNLTFDGTFTYGYDAENRLTSVTQGRHHGRDLRLRRARPPQVEDRQRHHHALRQPTPQNREVLEYDGTSGAMQRWYAFGSGPNDVLNQMNVAGPRARPFIPDIQGSIIGSLDSSSGTLTKTGYQPYGESGSPRHLPLHRPAHRRRDQRPLRLSRPHVFADAGAVHAGRPDRV